MTSNGNNGPDLLGNSHGSVSGDPSLFADGAPGVAEGTSVVVRIERTGGITGMRRTWQAEAPPADTDRLVALVRDCPWDAPAPAQPLPDRFVWHICVDIGEDQRSTVLSEADLTGAWRDLVSSVKDVAAHSRTGNDPAPSGAPSRTEATAHSAAAPTDEGN